MTLIVDYGTALLERAGPLIMTSVESAAPTLTCAASPKRELAPPPSKLGAFVRALADHGALRPGLDVQEATDILLVQASPHVHHLLRRGRGWTVRRYREWLIDTLIRTLLPDVP